MTADDGCLSPLQLLTVDQMQRLDAPQADNPESAYDSASSQSKHSPVVSPEADTQDVAVQVLGLYQQREDVRYLSIKKIKLRPGVDGLFFVGLFTFIDFNFFLHLGRRWEVVSHIFLAQRSFRLRR